MINNNTLKDMKNVILEIITRKNMKKIYTRHNNI